MRRPGSSSAPPPEPPRRTAASSSARPRVCSGRRRPAGCARRSAASGTRRRRRADSGRARDGRGTRHRRAPARGHRRPGPRPRRAPRRRPPRLDRRDARQRSPRGIRARAALARGGPLVRPPPLGPRSGLRFARARPIRGVLAAPAPEGHARLDPASGVRRHARLDEDPEELRVRPASPARTRPAKVSSLSIPLQSERLETDAPSSNPAGRDFPLGEPGFTYQDLHRDERLADLDAAFLAFLRRENLGVAERLEAYRSDPSAFDPLSRSRLLVEAARFLSVFVARLFGLAAERERSRAAAAPEAVLFRFRRDFLLRRAVKTKLPEDLAAFDPAGPRAGRPRPRARPAPRPPVGRGPRARHLGDGRGPARPRVRLHRRPAPEEKAGGVAGVARPRPDPRPPRRRGPDAACRPPTTGATRPSSPFSRRSSSSTPSGATCGASIRRCAPRSRTGSPSSCRRPSTTSTSSRPSGPNPDLPEERVGPADRRRRRDGFAPDRSADDGREVLGETHYCLLLPRAREGLLLQGLLRREDRGVAEEPARHRAQGLPARREDLRDARAAARKATPIGALALVCIDNPMCPGTGHRICNDCMKGCIFQKQDPVNIPQIETGVLTDVLGLPWGVEIYGLLTRWNPLNAAAAVSRARTTARTSSSSASGPPGYTLAHYLLNEGFGVVGIDGLKIEPLPADWTGADGRGIRPIRDYARARPAARRAPARRLRRRLRVRHHRPLGQELPDAHPPDARAGAGASRSSAACASAARSRPRRPATSGFDHVAIAAGAGHARRSSP